MVWMAGVLVGARGRPELGYNPKENRVARLGFGSGVATWCFYSRAGLIGAARWWLRHEYG